MLTPSIVKLDGGHAEGHVPPGVIVVGGFFLLLLEEKKNFQRKGSAIRYCMLIVPLTLMGLIIITLLVFVFMFPMWAMYRSQIIISS